MNDPIIEEVRKYRNEHAKRFNYDLDAICDDLIKCQSLHPQRLVSRKQSSNKLTSCKPRVANSTGLQMS